MQLSAVLTRLILPLAIFIMPVSAVAAACSAHSGAYTVPLLELYTSEGCSSCPPADKWLGGLAAYGSGKIVPLAFHVDYWDYIGWKDRFAKAEFSDRQRQAAAVNHLSFVYTPQALFNGSDFRDWQGSHVDQKIAVARKQPAKADLSLALTTVVSGEINIDATARIKNNQSGKDADVFVAIYENKLKSTVQAGENGGRELQHNYVVRKWLGPYRMDKDGALQRRITLEPEWKGRNAGVATFMQNRENGEVLQALSLAFCS